MTTLLAHPQLKQQLSSEKGKVRARTRLPVYLTRLGRPVRGPEPQFNLGPDTFLVPDLLVHPRAIATPDVRGTDALIVVEVAQTSLAYDLKTKARLHAAHGVPEYWVINASTLMTTVHTQPSGNAYASAPEIGPDTLLVPTSVPSLAISLDALAPK